jgi:7,8-dihydropterin-6-yl-methyl-4-(beta-D-ribofuranosyl)aminobenzene 5'-phosphate synthase
VKITILVDNIVPMSQIPFVGEHGLSLLIETESKKILVDVGQSSAVLHNMGLLGFHANQIDVVSISHGHYDHTGGLIHLLQNCRKSMPIYAHTNLFDSRYFLNAGNRKYIGVPFRKAEADSWGANWILSEKPIEIVPRLWFSGQIPRKTDFEKINSKFVTDDINGHECHDQILDDTVLYYASEKGLVVISGCAHSGMVNAIYHGFDVTGQKKLLGWVGGTHLGPASEAQRIATIELLRKFNPEFIVTSHCTGIEMLGKLKGVFGTKLIPGFVGAAIKC